MDIKTITMTAMATLLFVGTGLAAQQTWTGQISDATCGAKHMSGEHGMKVTDRECTLMCVRKGAKYVFVNDGKVLAIANQDFKGLRQHAGETVKLTGELKGDAVTVSKIEKAAKASH